MAESKLVPPPPPIAKSRAARSPISPAPRPPAPAIELSDSSIMSLDEAPESSSIELDTADILPPLPRARALEALSRPAPPIGRISAPSAKPMPSNVDPIPEAPGVATSATSLLTAAAAAPAPESEFAPSAEASLSLPTGTEDPLIDLPEEDDVDWNEAIARAKSESQAPAPQPVATPTPAALAVSRGMSDRMGGIEALSTIAPTVAPEYVEDPYAGDTFADEPRPAITPARMGLISAAASALVIVAVHLLGSGSANATPEVASEQPVKIIQAAAVFSEADEQDSSDGDQARDYEVVDNERARKLGTLGMRALEQGRPASARRMFKKALRANPRSRLALAGLGRYALHHKRYAEAVKYLERAVKIEPRLADNRRYLADAYKGLGRTEKARHHYNKAVDYGDAVSKDRLAKL